MYGYLHLGRVISFDEASGGYNLQSVGLARTSRWGPISSAVPGLLVGDRVVLGATGTSRDELIIIAKVGATFPGIADIPGLVAALAGKADDSEIVTILAALTSLDGRLDAVEPIVASHTGTLTSQASTLTSYGGRITTLEGRIGYVDVVTSVGGRPTTGLFDGRAIFRSDKGFMEFYDLAATKWRVRGTVSVAALADITDPVGDQVVLLSADKMLYRYISGTGWIAFRHTSVSENGRARYLIAPGEPNLGSSAPFKVPFATAEYTTADLTRSVDNKDFTINRTGWWELGARIGLGGSSTAGTTRWCWIGLSSDSSIRYITNSVPPAAFTLFISAHDRAHFTAGTVLSVWGFQDSGISLPYDLAQGQQTFTAKWDGP